MNKRDLATWITTGVLFVLTGCAGAGVRLYSQPEKAEVYQVRKGQAPVKVGETPMNLDVRDLAVAEGEGLTLRLTKEGHLPETLILPKSVAGSSINVHAILQAVETNRACEDQSVALRVVSDGVAKAQTLMTQRRYDEAEQGLHHLSLQYPAVSVLFDLLGNVYYLKKDLRKSFESYKQSQRIWPNNIETNRMIQKLEPIVGTRSPSGGP